METTQNTTVASTIKTKTDTNIASNTDTESESKMITMEAYNASRAETEELRHQLAEARAHGKPFEERERSRVKSWESDVKFFVNEELIGRNDPELSADVEPLTSWMTGFSEQKDIVMNRAVARALREAGSTLKRERTEASANKSAATELSNAMKQVDAITAERDHLKQRLNEMTALADERQDGLTQLSEELVKAGVLRNKNNFSSLLNREKPAAKAAEAAINKAVSDGLVEPGSSSTSMQELISESNNASRSTAASSSTTTNNNNVHKNNELDDPLLALVSRGQGTSRIMTSMTSHAFLGSNSDPMDVISSSIRAR